MEPTPNSKSRLCETCYALDIAGYFRAEKHVHSAINGLVGPTVEAVGLGTFETILAKSYECPFCDVLIQSMCNRRIWRSTTPQQYLTQSGTAGQELECWIFSYAFAQSREGKAFRIGIGTCIPNTRFFVQGAHAGDLQLMAEDTEKVGARNLFHGRRVPPTFDFALAREWLRLCEHTHAHEDSGSTFNGVRDMLVIDVEDFCLCECPPNGRYIALSYCWPRFPTLTTTKQNVAALKRRGLLKERLHELPRTIRDAITCVQQMGERFLWVDALCIIQDDDEHKMSQIYRMDQIYTESFLTIVAAYKVPTDQDEPCSGLPGIRPHSRQVRQHVRKVGGLTVSGPLDTLGEVLETTRWDTRAWTFQEQKMSQRTLYFTDAQAYFQCSHGVFCEDSIGEGADAGAKIYGGSNLWNNTGEQVTDDPAGLAARLSRKPYPSGARAVMACQILTADYCGRSLSFPEDILNAFQGVQNVLEVSLKTRFWYGLPEAYLDRALLWTLRGRQTRRTASVYRSSSGDGRTIVAPTWSWAGWQTRSEHGLYFYVSGVRSEAAWFVISHRGRVLYLDVLSYGRPTQLGPKNKNVQPEHDLPDEVLEAMVFRTAVDFSLEEWRYPQHLACKTAVARFSLLISEPRSLGPHGRLWRETGINMAIFDKDGRWAGSIMLDRIWLAQNVSGKCHFDFILLSRSERVHELLEDPAYFDRCQFEQRDWCLLNVMMVERRDGVGERLGVGFIHEDAWVENSPQELFIRLV